MYVRHGLLWFMNSVIDELIRIWKSKVLSRIRGALFYFHKNSFVAVSQHAVTMYVCKCEHCEELVSVVAILEIP